MNGPVPLLDQYPGSLIYEGAPPVPTPLAPDGWPFPPQNLSYRVGQTGYDGFFTIGAGIKARILQALPRDFDFTGKRIYEFGCGSGRALRHFLPEALGCEIWGSDIDYPSIEWLAQHMSPPLHVFQNTEQPTLPLESNSFDVVFTISVFTHIHAYWSHWLMELRRLLKPGGLCFMTFLGPNLYELNLKRPYVHGEYGMLVTHLGTDWELGGPNVYLAPEWIKKYWGGIFEIDLIALAGLMDFQSIVMMRKPAETGRPSRRKDAPVIQMGVANKLNPNAEGTIEAVYPSHYRLERAFGIRGRGEVPLRGSIHFKNDRPARATVSAGHDRLIVLNASSFSAAAEPLSTYFFSSVLDVSKLSPGSYPLRMEFLSFNGDTHWVEIPLVIEDVSSESA